ncbi:hypothetical protein AHiyo4_22210 [Arthrobacter sp. Hiyo4]|nr:hypothetical protein AHiyo4_22210 [Arthrobacter sp. Hiyo4]
MLVPIASALDSVATMGTIFGGMAVSLDGPDRHHGAGREVRGNPDDGHRVDPGVCDRCGDGVAKDVAVVVRHLKRPFPGKPGGAVARSACYIRRPVTTACG